jgi:hypothetical protein
MFCCAKKQTSEFCLSTVLYDGLNLKYVKEQTPTICLAAVRGNGFALYYVKEQTPTICLAAVRGNGIALNYVKEQTPEICLAAVQQNGRALRFVKEQTPTICLAAVQQDKYALHYVKLPYKNIHSFDTCHTSQGPFKDTICCICYDDILGEKKEVVCCLQCKQPFHADCLGDWFNTLKNNVCLICKDGNWKRNYTVRFETA